MEVHDRTTQQLDATTRHMNNDDPVTVYSPFSCFNGKWCNVICITNFGERLSEMFRNCCMTCAMFVPMLAVCFGIEVAGTTAGGLTLGAMAV